jgi:hypothetical protein
LLQQSLSDCSNFIYHFDNLKVLKQWVDMHPGAKLNFRLKVNFGGTCPPSIQKSEASSALRRYMLTRTLCAPASPAELAPPRRQLPRLTNSTITSQSCLDITGLLKTYLPIVSAEKVLNCSVLKNHSSLYSSVLKNLLMYSDFEVFSPLQAMQLSNRN